eukprot:523970-Amphidinium_carterae.2
MTSGNGVVVGSANANSSHVYDRQTCVAKATGIPAAPACGLHLAPGTLHKKVSQTSTLTQRMFTTKT